jgi:hypothetical protein
VCILGRREDNLKILAKEASVVLEIASPKPFEVPKQALFLSVEMFLAIRCTRTLKA